MSSTSVYPALQAAHIWKEITLQIHNNGYYTTKGLFTASQSGGESDKDQREEKKRTSKNIFASLVLSLDVNGP